MSISPTIIHNNISVILCFLCVVWALRKSTISIQDSFYVVMLHKLMFSLASHSLFPVIVALYCPHLFHPQRQAWSSLNFLHPKITSLLSPILLLNPSQSFCPPCTSLLICLSFTDCPGLQRRTVLSPWLCCKYLICTALHCCMSLAAWALHYVLFSTKL